MVSHLFRNLQDVASIGMDVTSDIALFITKRVEDNESLLIHREKIIDTVNKNSEGMFRYAGKCFHFPPSHGTLDVPTVQANPTTRTSTLISHPSPNTQHVCLYPVSYHLGATSTKTVTWFS